MPTPAEATDFAVEKEKEAPAEAPEYEDEALAAAGTGGKGALVRAGTIITVVHT